MNMTPAVASGKGEEALSFGIELEQGEVTQSIRAGIPVSVSVVDATGKVADAHA